MEIIEDLQYKGYKIIQRSDGFKFGVDAVLAAYFSEKLIRPSHKVADLGTGNGIISILTAARTEASEIVGLEIQSDIAEMAGRSVILNKLENRVSIVVDNITSCSSLPKRYFDHVITNPPYKKHGSGIVNPMDSKAIARHEILCTLEDVIKLASSILKDSGCFTMVNRPDRLCDSMDLMRKYKIEPKALRLVYPSPCKPPSMILVRGILGGKPELKVEAPLFIFDNNGEYTDEINAIYNRC